MPLVDALLAASAPTLAVSATVYFARRAAMAMRREARGAVLIAEHAAARSRSTADETRALVNGQHSALVDELEARDLEIAALHRRVDALERAVAPPPAGD